MDIININLPEDPGLNSLYYASSTTNQIKDYIVTFPSSASILSSYNGWAEFISSFGAEITSPGTITEVSAFRIAAGSNLTRMIFRITALRYVALKTMITGVLLFNNVLIPTKYAVLLSRQNLAYNLNLNLANATTALYGPPFNTKCFFAIRVITYET